MKDINIEIDQSDLDKKLKKLENIKNGTARATMRALNRTLKGMKTESWNLVKKNYTINKKKDFYNNLKEEAASLKDLSISLRSEGRPLRSVKFKHKKNRASSNRNSDYLGRSFRRAKRCRERGKDKGLRKKIKKGSGGWNRGKKSVFLHVEKGKSGNYLSGAFMANFTPGKNPSAGDSSLSGIFARVKGAAKKTVTKGTYKGLLRTPIEQRYSPGSVQMLKNQNIKTSLIENTANRFNKELDHQIEFLLSKQKG